MTYLNVEIVTPNGLVYQNDKAKLVVVRTVEGDLGILPNHAPIIAPLKIDVVRIKAEVNTDEQDIMAINGGIMEVRDNQLTIIAESAETPEDIDIKRAERAKERAEELIQAAKSEHDVDQLKRAEVALNRAINRINVARH